MNDEIKEILDRLERIDHKEYSCDFEFADSATFDEMARCFEERKKMTHYITNLQQENDNMEKIIKRNKYKKRILELEEACNFLQQENERLKELNENASKVCMAEHRYGVDKAEEARDYKSRCEKAVEYFKYQLENLDFYEDTKARMLCAMGITLLQNGSDDNE